MALQPHEAKKNTTTNNMFLGGPKQLLFGLKPLGGSSFDRRWGGGGEGDSEPWGRPGGSF